MNVPVFEQVAFYVCEHPNGVGRLDVALSFGIHKNTAISHLERAVQRGLIRKVYTWVSKRARGWVYYPYSPNEPPMISSDQYSS